MSGLAESGSRYLSTELFNGEHFIQNVDPAHPDIFNTNRGCHIDQLFGPLNAQVVVDRVTALDITANA